ncbi:MAG: hypothetical protein FJ368_03515 [Pelagibacterales bacterium]|nr:hypothetical protein [Pelagibacterales bacterium]
MKIKLFSFVLLFFISFSKISFAQELNYDSVGKAVAGLYAKTGNVTKEEYDAFWNEIGAKNNSDKQKIINFVKDNLLPMQEYQRETWKCAETSWNAQKVLQCPDLQKKYILIEASFKKNKQENQLKNIKEFSAQVLQSAAKRSSIKPEGGNEIPLSLEMIQMMTKNLDGIFARFSQVLKTSYYTK